MGWKVPEAQSYAGGEILTLKIMKNEGGVSFRFWLHEKEGHQILPMGGN